jgi:hypothetical protein
LADYYDTNHGITFVMGRFEYSGGNPSPYYYRCVSTTSVTGEIQVAEGWVVWDGATSHVVPTDHYGRPSNSLGTYYTHQVDPDTKGSTTEFSPGSTGPFAVITAPNPDDVIPMVGRTGGPVQPMSVVMMDYLTAVPDLTLSSADQIVSGTVSYNIQGLSAGLGGIMVVAFIDVDVTVAAAGQRVVGTLYRDGAAMVTPLATFSQVAVGRATIGMIWRYEPSDANDHTFDLYVRKTGAGGTAIVRANGTRLAAWKFDPMRTV